jgi:hypothetical protein
VNLITGLYAMQLLANFVCVALRTRDYVFLLELLKPRHVTPGSTRNRIRAIIHPRMTCIVTKKQHTLIAITINAKIIVIMAEVCRTHKHMR